MNNRIMATFPEKKNYHHFLGFFSSVLWIFSTLVLLPSIQKSKLNRRCEQGHPRCELMCKPPLQLR